MGILGQKFLFDPVHGHIHHAGRTLYGGDDSQQVPGTGRAHLIPVPHPGGFRRIRQFLLGHNVGGIGQIMEGRTFRQIQHMFVDPAAPGNSLLCIAQDHPITDDLAPFGDVHQGNLMGLGNGLQGNHSRQCFRSHRQVVDGNGYIVLLLDLDDKRCSHVGISPFC